MEAPAGSIPWQVSVGSIVDGKHKHECGGTIIDAKFVITAAHCTCRLNKRPYIYRSTCTNRSIPNEFGCTKIPAEHFSVLAGTTDLEDEYAIKRRVKHVFEHPYWFVDAVTGVR